MPMRDNRLIAAVIVIVALLLIGVIFGLRYLLVGAAAEIGLPVLAIAGVVLLLATLALVSVAFSVFGLDDKSQALALPEGSIRAVIALSLIVLFAVLSVYLYGSLSDARINSVAGLNAAQKANFIAALAREQVVAVTPDSGDGPFTVYFRDRNPASEDFAKQLLVLIGTLVTSVASFYFGTRAARSSDTARGLTRNTPQIRSIAPAHATRDAALSEVEFEIHGEGLDLVKEVKIVSGPHQIVAADIVSNASVVKGKLPISPDATLGSWDVIATDGLGQSARLPNGLTIAAPAQP
jgi:hypothetical protein